MNERRFWPFRQGRAHGRAATVGLQPMPRAACGRHGGACASPGGAGAQPLGLVMPARCRRELAGRDVEGARRRRVRAAAPGEVGCEMNHRLASASCRALRTWSRVHSELDAPRAWPRSKGQVGNHGPLAGFLARSPLQARRAPRIALRHKGTRSHSRRRR